MAQRNGTGMFPREVMNRFPLLPLEEEGRLNDMPLRENFVEQVFAYYRWTRMLAEEPNAGGLVKFHTAHKLTLMAHSPKHYTEMGRLRRLLSHTSGLNDGFQGGGWESLYSTEGAAPDVTVEQMLVADPITGLSAATHAIAVPGGAYSYNNLAYSIVQPLVESVTKVPFAAFMQSALLDPLKMNSSAFEQPLPVDLRDRATTEHGTSGEPVAGKRRHYPMLAAGGLWTTPSDLARFTIELMSAYKGESSTILSQELAKEMLSPQVEILGHTLEKAYGLGMALGYDGGVMRIQHMGGCPWGSNSWLIAYPETGQGAVVMTNSVSGSTIRAEIVLSIAIEYGWPLVAGIER